MVPRLRVLISSGSSTKPTVSLPVNSAEPTPLKTDSFDGSILVWVKGFEGDNKAGDGKQYFESSERSGMTYAIVVRGRFLEQVNAEDLLFGNTFERPIRDSLPWGTSIATKAMHFVEPTLQMDLYADEPWALSYALSSMNHLSVLTAPPATEPVGPFIAEHTLDWIQQEYKGEGALPQAPEGDEKARAVARKKWFSNEANRKDVTVDKNTYVGMEFCNGYLDFNTLSLSLPAQFNMSFPLLKYWDGQPVTYSCQRRGADGKLPGGKVFWQVAFEIVDEEAKKELEKRGGKVEEGATNGGAADTKSTQEDTSDDVD